MSQTETKIIPPMPSELDPDEIYDSGGRYDIVAWARGQRVLLYHEFGSYQGEWILIAIDGTSYFIYEDYYGSCSGCDHYEGTFHSAPTRSQAWEFVHDYPPFLVVEREVMRGLAQGVDGTIGDLFPAARRDTYSEISYPEILRDVEAIIKLEERLPLALADVLEVRNAEVKQRALRAFGYERFVAEAKPQVLDAVGDDQLLKLDDIVLVYLKDHSTDRRYLLRVPPEMRRVKQAVAWTFGLKESEYEPVLET